MEKQFVKINGRIWPITDTNVVRGVVAVSGYESLDREDRLDAISNAVTGSECGLFDFAYRYLGADLVSFSGQVIAIEVDESESEYATDVNEIKQALQRQYNLTDVEADHLMANIDNTYEDECVIDIVGSPRQMCSPAYPQDCDYVRVTVDGLEIAYWISDEWQEDPALVMGALMGAAKGG